jgi:hypothetical protein
MEQDRQIVCEALKLLRQTVALRYENDLSRLPRNGKAAATQQDEYNESSVAARLNEIDVLIKSYVRHNHRPAHSGKDAWKDLGAKQAPALPSKRNSIIVDEDYEPYINPFTGLLVIPEHPDAAGPSRRPMLTAPPSFNRNPEPRKGLVSSSHDLSGSDHVHENADASGQNDPAMVTHDNEVVASCDALWEVWGDDMLGSDDKSGDMGDATSKSDPAGGIDLRIVDAASTVDVTTNLSDLDKRDIEDALKDFEDQMLLKGYLRSLPPTDRNLAAPEPSTPIVMSATVTAQQVHPVSAANLQTTQHAVRDGNPPPYEPPFDAEAFPESVPFDSNFDYDHVKALELAGGISQDYQELQQTQTMSWDAEMQRLQKLQDELNRQEQEQITATLADIQHLQDDWNREADEMLRREQAMAQEIADQEDIKDNASAMEEMKRLQEVFQAEDNRRFEEDLKLARQPAQKEGASPIDIWFSYSRDLPETGNAPVNPWHGTDSSSFLAHQTNGPRLSKKTSPVPRSSVRNANILGQDPTAISTRSFGIGGASTPANLDSAASSRTIVSSRSLPLPIPTTTSVSDLSAVDEQIISANFDAAQRNQDAWEEEIRKNEKAARLAQEAVKRMEDEASRELERLRHEENKRRRAEEQRQEAERRARLARIADCSVCSESFEKTAMCRLPCNHYYCRDCIVQSIQVALKARKVFKCCKNHISADSISNWLPPQVQSCYSLLNIELGTPNPTYCTKQSCHQFIPPTSYLGDVARCPACSTETCRSCKNRAHPGSICKQDAAGQALLRLSDKKKWMQCPHCKTMVERRSGCLHMTCICGTGFCYNCGRSGCGGEICRRR